MKTALIYKTGEIGCEQCVWIREACFIRKHHNEIDDFLWNGLSWAGPVEIGGEAKADTNTSTMLNKSAEVLVYYVNKGASWTLSGETWTAATRGGKVEKKTAPRRQYTNPKGISTSFSQIPVRKSLTSPSNRRNG